MATRDSATITPATAWNNFEDRESAGATNRSTLELLLSAAGTKL